MNQPMRFCRAVGDLFEREQFTILDQIADDARDSRSRFAGGGWKLYTFYERVTATSTNPSAAEWKARIAKMDRWVAARPKSVTARIALASVYEKYAPTVTGVGGSQQVQNTMWKIFYGRLQHARELLEEAETMNPRDPHIQLIRLRIARDQALDRHATQELLDKAVAVEPGYYYIYMEHAVTLRRFQETGESDPVHFAEAAADKIGGPEGDIVYFHIAHELTGYEHQYLNAMSWSRIYRGLNSSKPSTAACRGS